MWIVSGELWLGLEEIHQLTSGGSYSLHITLKDFDHKSYVAIYDQFQVIMICNDDGVKESEKHDNHDDSEVE